MISKEDFINKLEYYCSYQERCHHEVVNKLYLLKCPVKFHDEIVVHLIQHNFLNEERFANLYVISKWNQKKWGKTKISLALKQKNISDRLIQQALLQIEDADYINHLKTKIKQYSNEIKEVNQFKKNQKIIQKLYQKGFEKKLILEQFDDDTF